ncbi:MAG: hypothetical protein JO352_05195 [Chloroflexi bacterium]|nr:hypothetical protein [Chloroflexota bacterium]MBV9598272.1 hypothetical protein [Chloroflexota bacterium]
MKSAAAGIAALLAGILTSVPLKAPALAAPPGSSATATAHALDELANCRAQRRPECQTESVPPTLTPTTKAVATATPVPTPTNIPPPEPTDTPAAGDPPLPVPDPGQAIAAYVRPTPRDPSGTWLELALPEGRWAVLYDTSQCSAPVVWTNVWLALDDQSGGPITADRNDGGMCAVAQWSWSSNLPCGSDGLGTCDVAMEDGYRDAGAQPAPAATDSPVPAPTSTPAPRPPAPTAAPVVQAPRIVYVQQPTVPTATPRVVYVEVTRPPEIQNLPMVIPTSRPVSTPTPAAAATPSAAPSDTPVTTTAEATEVLALADTPATSVVIEAAAPADPAPSASQPSDWTADLVVAVVALIIGAFFVLIGRRSGRPW